LAYLSRENKQRVLSVTNG